MWMRYVGRGRQTPPMMAVEDCVPSINIRRDMQPSRAKWSEETLVCCSKASDIHLRKIRPMRRIEKQGWSEQWARSVSLWGQAVTLVYRSMR